jgi:hypothetical protein
VAIIMGNIVTLHMDRLKPFFGPKEEAWEMVMLDQDQHTVEAILAHRGDPLERTTMEFEVAFRDGSTVWLPWSKDIFDTMQYEDYCRARRPLHTLMYKSAQVKEEQKRREKEAITDVQSLLEVRRLTNQWHRTSCRRQYLRHSVTVLYKYELKKQRCIYTYPP